VNRDFSRAYTLRSRWPVCGKCCEVAYFSWVGGPHECLTPEPEISKKKHAVYNADLIIILDIPPQCEGTYPTCCVES